ncbi:MAG: ATP-binding protein [Geobacteraceae bacterium]|nr:ATP-binding protein [Geobacteraceae bacterium]
MYSRKEIPFNIVTLSFSNSELETAFRADYFEKNIRHLRLYLLLGFLLYGLFAIHDYWIIPDMMYQAWSIRFLLVCPLLLAILLFSFSKKFHRLMQPSLVLAGFTAGAGIIAMVIMASPQGSYLYYIGLLLCLMFFFRLRFFAASLLSWSVFLLYEAALLLKTETPTPILFSNTFIFLSFLIAGMFMCYTLERYNRSDFLLRRTIHLRNHEISAANRALEKESLDHRQAAEENLRLKAQLTEAQKMEAVGQLAGGVAHEFNNILTAVVGYANYIQMKMDKDNPLHPYAGNIIASANRAARLSNDLLAFSRKKQFEPRVVNLNDIMLKAENMLPLIVGKKIRVSITLCESPLIILADEVLLEQALVNLAANARDAMPNGGVLSISTDRFETASKVPCASGTVQPGRYARITVTDMGIGMDEKTRARIFEPFFTTKEVGKSTGLGLSMVHGIVRQHQGLVDCSSQIGTGTNFRIILPLIFEETV